MNAAFPGEALGRAACDVPEEFLYAKLHGRRSRLYEGDRLRELAAEASLEDLALRLFPQARRADRAEFERQVMASCVAELASLARFLVGARYAFYMRLLGRYPIENLKVLLRLLGSEEDPAGHLVELPAGLALPVEKLTGAGDARQFLEAIPMSRVRRCALQALPAYEEGGKKAWLEMAFDRGYWLGVRDGLGRLSASERPECARPVRRELDAMRLLATLRAAAVYGLSWDEWRPFVPAGGGRVGEQALRDIHARPELSYVAERLPGLWATVAPMEPQDIGELEEALWRQVVRAADHQFYASSGALGVMVGYFYLKRDEMRHLLGLAQMLRYGKAADEILDYLGL